MDKNKNKHKKIKPFLKWAGGKTRELNIIERFLPKKIENYYEPFIGGGAVWLATDLTKRKGFINDYSKELISFYKAVKNEDEIFFSTLNDFVDSWNRITSFCSEKETDLVSLYLDYKNSVIEIDHVYLEISKYLKDYDLFFKLENNNILENQESFFLKYVCDKYKRTKCNELKRGDMSYNDYILNIETGFKASLYMYTRSLYNYYRKSQNKVDQSNYSATYYIIREFCYSSMFRFNQKTGAFNVPYGGNSYNSKNLELKINHLKNEEVREHLKNTQINQGDFEDFIKKMDIKENDFIFLDPPYDSEFSDYDDNVFDKKEQVRLANLFINDVKGNWMMVIKKTDFIFNLYNGNDNIFIYTFDKKYSVSFMDRNNQDVKHIVITNYKIEEN